MRKLPVWLKFGLIFAVVLSILYFSLSSLIPSLDIRWLLFPIGGIQTILSILMLPFIPLMRSENPIIFAIVVSIAVLLQFMAYLILGSLIGRIYQQYAEQDEKKRNWKSLPLAIKVLTIIYVVSLVMQGLVWYALPQGFAP